MPEPGFQRFIDLLSPLWSALSFACCCLLLLALACFFPFSPDVEHAVRGVRGAGHCAEVPRQDLLPHRPRHGVQPGGGRAII